MVKQPESLAKPVCDIGLSRLYRDQKMLDKLKGQRVGLLAHGASYAVIGGKLEHALEVLLRAGLQILRLFSPEHGFYGQIQAGERVADGRDERFSLPIVSLYGARKAPEPAHLADLDVVVVDMQDVGVRCFTYLSTLKALFEVCLIAKTKLLVLERPNPLGRAVFGRGVEPGYTSFVSALDVPFVHGKTLAELAFMLAEKAQAQDSLELISVSPWSAQPWPETGLPWLAPSPNLRRFEAVVLYPALVFFEGTALSEGRGTEYPFEQFGAPWLDAKALLLELDLKALQAEVVEFRPQSSKYQGQLCQGLRFYAQGLFDPLDLAEQLLKAVYRQAPDMDLLRVKDGRYFMDLLYGSSALREAMMR